MRLIDADALKLEELSLKKGCTFLDMALAVIKSVKEAPTVDAKPIVYCKDCKHTTGSKLKCSKFNEIQMSGLHFCSYGERKDGAE